MDSRPRLLLSIDLEDWHQLVHRRLGLADWDRPYPEFRSHVRGLLDLLDELGARATFFMLGMTVANHRDLVREIVARGHDPASHGYAHARVPEQTPDQFRDDIERSVVTIESTTGRRPVAYRAPAYFGEEVRTSVRPSHLERSSFRTEFRMDVADRLIAEGYGVYVGYDYVAEKAQPLAEPIVERLSALPEGPQNTVG